MTRAVVVTILTLCCCGVSLVTAAEETKATCTAQENPKITKISRTGTITLECPANLELNPPLPVGDSTGPVIALMSPKDETQPESVCKACPGIGCTKATKQAKSHSLTITQLPPKSKTFYFRCAKKAAGQPSAKAVGQTEECYIGIEVVAATRLGPNTCAVAGSHINFSVQNAGEVVEFACPASNSLQPDKDKRIYDESCTKEIDLPEDVILTKKENDGYQLTVQKLGATPPGICYICVGKTSAGADQKCQVRIAVASQGFAAASARTAAGLGLIFAAVVFLHVQ